MIGQGRAGMAEKMIDEHDVKKPGRITPTGLQSFQGLKGSGGVADRRDGVLYFLWRLDVEVVVVDEEHEDLGERLLILHARKLFAEDAFCLIVILDEHIADVV